MRKTFLLCMSLAITSACFSQALTIPQYIDLYKDIAVREMQRTGIPASITLAQGILETESGNSDLVKRSNNHFGIKCKSNWKGESVYHDDDERGECFRKYNSAAESYRDHSDFLKYGPRYAFLFELDVQDYKAWAVGLKKAGYATNPRYPQILISNIERYNLHQYTLQGLATQKLPEPLAEVEKPVVQPRTGEKTVYLGHKALFATRGTSLLAIATQQEIALSRLLEYNDLETDGLLKTDQWIFLEKKARESNTTFVLVKKGEDLSDIARQNAVQLEYLEQYNQVKRTDLLQPGSRIYLRQVAGEKEMAKPQERKVHDVAPREGLYAISKKYNVTVNDIKTWNNLTSDDLQVGQQLYILK